jgi:phosphate-selective porin OprO/OprP
LFNERALPTALMPNRDIGFQLWGDIAGSLVSYTAGIFNGVGDGRSTGTADFEDHREFAGRLFLQPFKKSTAESLQGFGFGIGGSWGTVANNLNGLPATTGGLSPGYATDGQQQFFAYNPTVGTVLADGDHWRLSPQGYYYCGPFGLLGEYVISNQRVSNAGAAAAADLQHSSWQITASWVLTGEDASYTGVTPRKPFDLRNGSWGAFQLVGRYAELNIDDDTFPVFSNPATSASSAQAWSVGLNWYLNKSIRMNASYSHTMFTGGGGAGTTAPANVTRQDEQVFFSRLQLVF